MSIHFLPQRRLLCPRHLFSMDHKKAKLDNVGSTTDVDHTIDGALPPTATTTNATKIVALKPDHAISDREIVVALRPFVLGIQNYDDKDRTALCTNLVKLHFLQCSFDDATTGEILVALRLIYVDAIQREASSLTSQDDLEMQSACIAAVEMRNAFLYSELKDVVGSSSRMKVYGGLVPDVLVDDDAAAFLTIRTAAFL